MVHLSNESVRRESSNNNFIGPLLYGGALYSGMGLEDFKLIQIILYPGWNGDFYELPEKFRQRPRPQCYMQLCNIVRIGGNKLEFHESTGTITLQDKDLH